MTAELSLRNSSNLAVVRGEAPPLCAGNLTTEGKLPFSSGAKKIWLQLLYHEIGSLVNAKTPPSFPTACRRSDEPSQRCLCEKPSRIPHQRKTCALFFSCASFIHCVAKIVPQRAKIFPGVEIIEEEQVAEGDRGEEVYFRVGDVVWRKMGYSYQKATITGIDGERVNLGGKEATIDDLLPASVFAVAEEIKGLVFEASIYEYLVFRTYKSNRLRDMGSREGAEGLYVEKPVCSTYRRQHFPGHPAGKYDVLKLLAALEEQA